MSRVTTLKSTFLSAVAFSQILCWETTGMSTSSVFDGSSGSFNPLADKCACVAGKYYTGSDCFPCAGQTVSSGKTESCIACSGEYPLSNVNHTACAAMTPAPTPIPSNLPIPAPSKLPVPSPSNLPTTLPIPAPSPAPSTSPSQVPTVSFLPSNLPIPAPSKLPVPSPSNLPTTLPSTLDTVSLDVTLKMIASSTPTTDDEASLKTMVAISLRVEEGVLKSFTVTSSLMSRHLRRYLLASYPWTVSFTVTNALSETESSSAEDFADYVTTALTSASFVSAVYSSVGATVDTSSVTATARASRVSSDSSNSTNAAGIVIGVVFGLLVLIVASVAVYLYRGNKLPAKCQAACEKMNVSCAPAVKFFDTHCKSNKVASNQEKIEARTNELEAASFEIGTLELKSKRLVGKEQLAKLTVQAEKKTENVGQTAFEEGSVVQFLVEADFSAARAALVATLFAKHGYELAKDFNGLTKNELDDGNLKRFGLEMIDIRKFRRAVDQASKAPSGTTL